MSAPAEVDRYIKRLPPTSSEIKMLPATSSEYKKEIRMLPGWSATSMGPGADSSVRVVARLECYIDGARGRQ